jgi:hypothetical protein
MYLVGDVQVTEDLCHLPSHVMAGMSPRYLAESNKCSALLESTTARCNVVSGDGHEGHLGRAHPHI